MSFAPSPLTANANANFPIEGKGESEIKDSCNCCFPRITLVIRSRHHRRSHHHRSEKCDKVAKEAMGGSEIKEAPF